MRAAPAPIVLCFTQAHFCSWPANSGKLGPPRKPVFAERNLLEGRTRMTLMIADPPTSGTRLGVGLDANRSRARNEAWKAAIGTKPVPARLALLPEGERRWDRLRVNAVSHILALTFFLAHTVSFPETHSALKYSGTPQ